MHTPKVTLSNAASSFKQPVQRVLPFPQRLVSHVDDSMFESSPRANSSKGKTHRKQFRASCLLEASLKRCNDERRIGAVGVWGCSEKTS